MNNAARMDAEYKLNEDGVELSVAIKYAHAIPECFKRLTSHQSSRPFCSGRVAASHNENHRI